MDFFVVLATPAEGRKWLAAAHRSERGAMNHAAMLNLDAKDALATMYTVSLCDGTCPICGGSGGGDEPVLVCRDCKGKGLLPPPDQD